MSNPFSTAVTVCLVEQAALGPFVLHGEVEQSFQVAKDSGFDAVELFLPDGQFLTVGNLTGLLDKYGLRLAAVGTGAGWLIHQYSLTSSSANARQAAVQFIKSLIDLGGAFGAPAIIGSMQGRHEPGERVVALERLSLGLRELSEYASQAWKTRLLYEPLNRYETNLFNRVGDTRLWLESEGLANVQILADLFHMNIEEVSLVEALRDNWERVGHIHWADSNRSAMGMGHTDFALVLKLLRDLSYKGFISAEVFPFPTGPVAAQQTIKSLAQ